MYVTLQHSIKDFNPSSIFMAFKVMITLSCTIHGVGQAVQTDKTALPTMHPQSGEGIRALFCSNAGSELGPMLFLPRSLFFLGLVREKKVHDYNLFSLCTMQLTGLLRSR